jgi:nucleotide-binding universal stress UspA family protein
MGYRTILVHVDDSDQSDRRIAVAARLAQAFHAELAGAYLTPLREITPFTSALLPDAVVESRLRESGDAQAQAEARFRAGAAQGQLMSVGWTAPAGKPVEQAVSHARYADLAVIGQPATDTPSAGFESDLAHAVLLSSGRPVLFLPRFGNFPTIGQNVLIAWKDSREAARAVNDALPFLKRANQVYVMTVSEPDADDASAVKSDLSASGIASFLARHGIDAEMRREVADDIDVGNLLLSRAADLSIDLIVMGAYSRPRISEIVLGGVTRLLLEAMTVPVLMGH